MRWHNDTKGLPLFRAATLGVSILYAHPGFWRPPAIFVGFEADGPYSDFTPQAGSGRQLHRT
jgi:hypothetical protein